MDSKITKQGDFFSGNKLSANQKSLAQGSRASIDARNSPIGDTNILVVLTQDCDIHGGKTDLELAVGKKVNKSSTVVTNGRAFNKLQIEVSGIWFEFERQKLCSVPLVNISGITPEGSLDEKTKQIFIDWRVNSYNREPFPDLFNRLFVSPYLKDSGSRLGDYLRENFRRIENIFAWVNPKDEGLDNYQFSVTVLLCMPEGEIKTPEEKRFQQTVDDLVLEALEEVHLADNGLHAVQVDDKDLALPIALLTDTTTYPHEFSLLNATVLKRLTLDFLCYD